MLILGYPDQSRPKARVAPDDCFTRHVPWPWDRTGGWKLPSLLHSSSHTLSQMTQFLKMFGVSWFQGLAL